MDDLTLINKITSQAVRIAELERLLEDAHNRLERLPSEIRNSVLRQLANSAVNCGPSYGCALVNRLVND